MRIKFIAIVIVTQLSILQGFAQKNEPYKYYLEKKISFKNYINNDFYMESKTMLPSIIGIDFINDKYCFWVSQQNVLTTWNWVDNKLLSNCLLSEGVNYDAVYSKKLGSVFLNTYIEKSEIKLFGIEQNCNLLENFKIDSNITFRTICVSPNGKNIVVNKDSALHLWTYKGINWAYKKITIDEEVFDIKFLNDDIILLGCYSGNVIFYDIKNFSIKSKLKVFENTISNFSIVENKLKFATTDGVLVKILEVNKEIITIESNVKNISALKWLDENTLIIAGMQEAIEIWYVKDKDIKKLIQDFNIHKAKKEKENLKSNRQSFLFYSNFIKTDSIKFDSEIRGLGVNNNVIGIVNRNKTFSLYSITDSLRLKSRQGIRNVLKMIDDGTNFINDIDVDNNLDLAIAYNSGFQKDSPIEIDNFGMCDGKSYLVVDAKSFDDVIIAYQQRNKTWSEEVSWIKNEKRGKNKRSELFKEIQKTLPEWGKGTLQGYFTGSKTAVPLGFDVSNDEKHIIIYTKEQIQVIQVKGLKTICEDDLKIKLKRVFFSQYTNKLILISDDNNIYYYDFRSKSLNTIKENVISNSFKNVEYNNNNLLAFYDSNLIIIFDFNKQSIIFKTQNTNLDFSISKFKFLNDSDKFSWVLNEKEPNKLVETAIKDENQKLYGQINCISLSNDKNLVIFGNTLGEILFFKRQN
jgi:hypothetical protein